MGTIPEDLTRVPAPDHSSTGGLHTEEMVLNVEAPYYEIGFGALHVEDPIVVRSGGGRLLSKGSRDLVIL